MHRVLYGCFQVQNTCLNLSLSVPNYKVNALKLPRLNSSTKYLYKGIAYMVESTYIKKMMSKTSIYKLEGCVLGGCLFNDLCVYLKGSMLLQYHLVGMQ